MHFICNLCGKFLMHSHTHIHTVTLTLTHSLAHRSLFMQFPIYNNSYFFSSRARFFSSLFNFVEYNIPISQCTYTSIHIYKRTRSWTRSLLLNSRMWTLYTVVTHMSVLCSLMLFLEFSFIAFRYACVYTFPLVLLLFFWSMWEFLWSQMFFSRYTLAAHFVRSELNVSVFRLFVCALRSHANVTPFICLNLINSWSY